MRFLFWGFFDARGVTFDIEFGGVNGLGSGVDEDVESKVQ